jgi:WD40 repeat protein
MLILHAQKQQLHRVAFSPDGFAVAAAGGRGAYYWTDPHEDTEGRRFGESLRISKKPFSSIGFTTDGNYLIGSRSLDGVLALRLKDDHYQYLRSPGKCVCVEPSPTEPRILVCNTITGSVSSWEITRDGKFTAGWSVGADPESASGQPAFSPDGKWFAHPAALNPTAYSFSILIRETKSGKLLNHLHLADYILGGLVVSPDGKSVGYRCNNRFDVIQVSSAGSLRARIRSENLKHFTGVAFHPSGRYLAATSNDETVKLYDTETWRVAKTFTWDIGKMRSVGFSPDGTLAAAGSDTGRVVVWDVDV